MSSLLFVISNFCITFAIGNIKTKDYEETVVITDNGVGNATGGGCTAPARAGVYGCCR